MTRQCPQLYASLFSYSSVTKDLDAVGIGSVVWVIRKETVRRGLPCGGNASKIRVNKCHVGVEVDQQERRGVAG